MEEIVITDAWAPNEFNITEVSDAPFEGIAASLPTANSLCLRMKAGQTVKTARGAMQAYTGQVSFSGKRPTIKAWFLNRIGMSDVLEMMECKAVTDATVFFTNGERVKLVQLQNQELLLDAKHVLALVGKGLTSEVTRLKSVTTMVSAGGLFQLKVTGTGVVAMTTSSPPLVLDVSPETPVFVDPEFTVGWTGGVDMAFKLKLSTRDLIGRGAGEMVQAKYSGSGLVVSSYQEPEPTPEKSSNGVSVPFVQECLCGCDTCL